MTAADKKIIAAHPDATPHDLLTLHGLSQAGWTEVVAQHDAQAAQGLKSKPPVLQPNISVLQPILSQHTYAPNDNKVRVIPPTGGNGTLMSKRQAEKLAKSNPKYKIVY